MSRVLELLGPSSGGIRAHVAALSGRLEANGWIPEIAGPEGVMDQLWSGVKVVPVPNSISGADLPRAVAACRSLARHHDVVHAHGLKAALVAKLAGGAPLVVTVHNTVITETAGSRERLMRRIEAWLVRHCDRVIVISAAMERDLALNPADPRVRRIYPVSEPKFPRRTRNEVRAAYDIEESAPLIVCVARLHPQKDLDMLLTAVDMARERVPDIRLLLVGDGPQRQELMAVTESLGLREVVTFAGAQPWPMDEIGAADAVALSSVWEGSPIVAVETLRIGTPLVTTAVGSLPEYLHDGKNCRMVPVGDAAAFSAALVWTLTHPEPARQLGQRGRGVAEELFSPDKLARSVAEEYDEVVR